MRYVHHPFSGAAAAAAVWLALIPLSTLVTGADWLLQVLPVLLVPATVGLALGLLRAPRLATLTAQLVAVGAVLVWRGLAVADPGGGWLTALRRLTADGVAAIRAGVPPMALTPGLGWLVLLLAGVLLIVVSLLVDTLEQPGWSVVPLALPYGIAAITQVDDLGVALLLPVVAGYLLVLFSSAGTPRRRARCPGGPPSRAPASPRSLRWGPAPWHCPWCWRSSSPSARSTRGPRAARMVPSS
ncbi:transglutaminaseTgpA domain-containing protein [Tessaracoccus defluvii]|uniref:Protein-glutamine gamma-glutamyltransferase TgpA N-terminal domain-containing protein n=1 Tax=Tessaracoccus defluvii TaxID=1285901 RepID=A0A7H0H913_9ACTN|nr:hypothetical protein H9L22_06865 [Tessaracoccus defluvii]